MSCQRPLTERLWPLSVCIFLPVAAGCGLGSGDNNGQGAAFINSQNGADAGPRPDEDGGGFPHDPSCDGGVAPGDECSALGGICLPLDPATGWIECPEGLYPIAPTCGDPNLPAICCGRIEEPPPPTDCYGQGGYCAPFDRNQGFACPDGNPGSYDPSCGDPMNGGGLCCVANVPPPPPGDECSSVGGICLPAFDPNDPSGQWYGCPPGLAEIPAACGDDGSGVRSVCCGRIDEPPPPTDCAGIGGFCGRFDEQLGFFCPDGSQPVAFDPNCGDPQLGGGVCCLPGEPPPPADCAAQGGYCGGFDAQTGEIYCGPNDLIFEDPTCGDPQTGRGICCVPGGEPPPSDCASLGGYCGGYDLQTGEVYCDPTSQVFEDPSCGDLQLGGGICCVPGGEPPPPPPGDACTEIGGFCAPFDENFGGYCPEGSVPSQEILCGDPNQGVFGLCCVRDDQPPTPVCPDPNAPNVFYVSQDPALCAAISYTCPSNHVVFDSDCGCGCIGY